MFLSVIITNYKTPDLLKLCLESIKIAGAELEYEIIIVDSEAEEETGEWLKEDFSEAKLISFKKNIGYARLVNAGLALARGRYLLVLNADLIVFPDALRHMIDYLEAGLDVGLLGPQLLNFNGAVQETCFRWYRPMTIFFRRTILGKTGQGKKDLERFTMKDFDRQSTREVDWMLGAALMLRREALKKVGPMDERFFLYFEDVDWCRRFHQAGWRVVYFPKAKMHHYHGRVSKKSGGIKDIFLNKYTWIHLFSAFKYFWKYR